MKEPPKELPSDFWSPRHCFLTPPPEVHEAANLLNKAADAVIQGFHDKAAELILEADISSIYHSYVKLISGPTNLYIHRYREVPGLPAATQKIKQRMPSIAAKKEIYRRDGWRCRFCGVRVCSPEALKQLRVKFPTAVRWGARDVETHSAIVALQASVDHIRPHSRGGDNDPRNLVTTCNPCNYGRSSWTLEEVGLIDPTLRPPIVDEWDGLTRLLLA